MIITTVMMIIHNSFVHSLMHTRARTRAHTHTHTHTQIQLTYVDVLQNKFKFKKKKAHGLFVTCLATAPHFKHHYKSYHSVNLKKMAQLLQHHSVVL